MDLCHCPPNSNQQTAGVPAKDATVDDVGGLLSVCLPPPTSTIIKNLPHTHPRHPQR